ncbi:hypothetical protein [Xenorhabdus szentirmaii]|uniref:Uncharacterized protein n=2 Tax=Xenorhabdus szentirmaii TaxID=290112 RepID=W1IZ42_9GAMM|nr:hypothetical protein [Xenorhabdus szentirmaii]PHM30847.1 hypothetical protein Xsze_03961 [Xenorhabdus szentirmaii DSM 16338]CDL83729.1 hypothetical protein XSR1_360013 [Xenorhabdus szentirmaii DSM 16338]
MKELNEIVKSHDSVYIVTSRGLEREEAVRERASIRKEIDRLSDSVAREGILSDILGVLLVHFSSLVVELTKIKTLEDIKIISQPLAEVFDTIDEAIKDGTLTLPYMVKSDGISKSFSDMKNLSNGISKILHKVPSHEK